MSIVIFKILQVIGVATLLGGIVTWMLEQPMTDLTRTLLMAGLLVWFTSTFIYAALRKKQTKRDGIPVEDELSRLLQYRAGSAAYSLSMTLWISLLVTGDLFARRETMLAVGLMMQLAAYGICYLYYKYMGVNNE